MAKIEIEFGFRCPRCEELMLTSAHGTVEDCEKLMGRKCEFPQEHHVMRKRPMVRFKFKK